jgi:predicted permease
VHRLVSALASVGQDLRYGTRLLARSPWYTLVAIASLAVGLGMAVALFTVLNAVLFRPLPGRDTEDVHALYTSNSNGGRYGGSSFADFQSFISVAPELFAGSCALARVRANVVVAGRPEPVNGNVVSGGCFDLLGLRPHLGRLIHRGDETRADRPAAVVISYSFWRRAFGGEPDVVGRATSINGTPAAIVGVAPAGFAGASLDDAAEFWAPVSVAPTIVSPRSLTARGERRFRLYARLNDGVTALQAAVRLASVAERLRADAPESWTHTNGSTRTVTVEPERAARFSGGGGSGAVAAIAAAGVGAIGGIVAMACVNLATLTLARGAARTRELSIRLALGASPRRLVRQLALESLIVSLSALAGGVLLVMITLRWFESVRPPDVPGVSLTLDWRVAVTAASLALVAPVFFGAAPGSHVMRLAIAEGLQGRIVQARRRVLRWGAREVLIVVQVAASFALIVMATLFLTSLAQQGPAVSAVSRNVAVVPIELNTAATSEAEVLAVTDRLLQTARHVAGVDSVSAAAFVPLTGSFTGFSGKVDGPSGPVPAVFDGNLVGPGYFELLGIVRRAGRTFDARDHASAPRVVVVSESLARQLWRDAPAVGRELRLDDGAREVVGVVADTPYRSREGPQPVLYVPLAQEPRQRFVLHARVRDAAAIAALDRAVRTFDERIIVGESASLEAFHDRIKTPAKVAQWIGGAAGVMQLGLALMATWGLVAYAVERRTAEVALRRALGATSGSILRLVLRPSVAFLAIGGSLGIILGIGAARVLHANFPELAPADLRLTVPAGAALAAIVLIAAWLPARRATRIEPASALKGPL